MPQPNSFDPRDTSPVSTRRCPACGEPMFLAVIEPTYQRSYDIRTLGCLKCAYAEIILVNFDESWGDDNATAGAAQHETVNDPDEDEPTEVEKEAKEKAQ